MPATPLLLLAKLQVMPLPLPAKPQKPRAMLPLPLRAMLPMLLATPLRPLAKLLRKP